MERMKNAMRKPWVYRIYIYQGQQILSFNCRNIMKLNIHKKMLSVKNKEKNCKHEIHTGGPGNPGGPRIYKMITEFAFIVMLLSCSGLTDCCACRSYFAKSVMRFNR